MLYGDVHQAVLCLKTSERNILVDEVKGLQALKTAKIQECHTEKQTHLLKDLCCDFYNYFSAIFVLSNLNY